VLETYAFGTSEDFFAEVQDVKINIIEEIAIIIFFIMKIRYY
jgi:hypothetical protein